MDPSIYGSKHYILDSDGSDESSWVRCYRWWCSFPSASWGWESRRTVFQRSVGWLAHPFQGPHSSPSPPHTRTHLSSRICQRAVGCDMPAAQKSVDRPTSVVLPATCGARSAADVWTSLHTSSLERGPQRPVPSIIVRTGTEPEPEPEAEPEPDTEPEAVLGMTSSPAGG